jgi:hypothetical protein
VAVSTVLWPTQIAAGAAEADTVGSGLTVTVTVVVFEQPLPSVPVTVYVVVVAGLKVWEAPVSVVVPSNQL